MKSVLALSHRSNFFIFSLSLHVLVLFLFIYYVDLSSLKKFGNQEVNFIPTYVAQEFVQKTKKVEQQKVQSDVTKQVIQKNTIPLIKKTISHQPEKKITPITSAMLPSRKPQQITPKPSSRNMPKSSRAKLKGDPTPILLSILHAAIQKQQRYPQSALQMNRAGRITLAFTLFPTGTIKNLRIIQSSGTNSLDLAALAAVNQATPFQGIAQYLDKAGDYRIDVVFELT